MLEVRPSALLYLLISVVVCVAAVAIPASAFSTSFLARDAIDYLKTRGLLPLWAGAARPVLPWDIRAALDAGDVAARVPTLSAPDLAVLQWLDAEFGLEDSSVGFHRQFLEVSAVAPFGIPRANGSLSGSTDSSSWTAGWAADSFTGFLAARESGFSWLAGRTPLGWGPGPIGGELLFDGSTGGFDALQVSFVWRKVRFTKVVGWLDAGRSIVGTRMDMPYRPNLRLGFSESILMDGAPYLPYVLNPIPIALNPGIWEYLRQPQGIDDNFFLGFDTEWVPHPGLRIFGELLIDDFTVPTPTANFPSRWGLTVGVHRVSEEGAGFQATYTVVPNWTYSTSKPALDYLLRGLPLGHVLGADFDAIQLRWMPSNPPAASFWAAYIRKGEGKVGQIWTSQQEAWQHVFLSGTVESTLLVGLDAPLIRSGWAGTVGPWVAFRTNADHVAGTSRVDWGLNLSVTQFF